MNDPGETDGASSSGDGDGATASSDGDREFSSRETDASDRGSDAVTRPGGRGSHRISIPAYGSVEVIVVYVLFYLIVDLATPVIVEELSGPFPDQVPEPVTTYAAVTLWLFLGLVLFATVRTQLAENPRVFDDADEREAFLDEHRPTLETSLLSGALVVVGGAAALFTWDVFVAVLEDVLSVLVVELDGDPPALPGAADVALFVSFVGGVAAVARGLDRLVVGGARELLYRRYRE